MIVELGKTYLDRTGSICKVVAHTAPSIIRGTDEFFTYFPVEGGKENRERAFQVDKYGSHLGEDHIYDLVIEYTMPDSQCDLQWVWGPPDKIGLWAFGGCNKEVAPVLKEIVVMMVQSSTLMAWRCYLGPIPRISQPKKLVKQTLWMVKYNNCMTWEELWLTGEDTPKFRSFHDVGHKTTTTRYV